jgi:uncharacterized protein YeaO (DUF488 family)
MVSSRKKKISGGSAGRWAIVSQIKSKKKEKYGIENEKKKNRTIRACHWTCQIAPRVKAKKTAKAERADFTSKQKNSKQKANNNNKNKINKQKQTINKKRLLTSVLSAVGGGICNTRVLSKPDAQYSNIQNSKIPKIDSKNKNNKIISIQ